VRPRAVALAALVLGLAAPLAAQEVRGRVLDAATGAPIAEADVLLGLDGWSARILTDGAGRFRFDSPGGARRLRVRRLGYARADVAIDRERDLTVRLEPLPVALDAIVVTAARREQRLADAVVATELISAADIARSGAPDVATLLTERTGIQLDGGVPAGAGAMLQGLGAQRVLVLLDGQPVVGRVNGNLDLSRLPVSAIERVEVVKGPQSTLYGSDALGGVINLFTRRPPAGGASARAGAAAGSHGRREVTAGWAVVRGTVGWSADGGFRTVDLAPGVGAESGTLARRWHAAPSLRWQAGEAWTLEAAALVVGERQRYRTGQLYHHGDNTQVNARVAATRRRGTSRVAPVLSLSRFDHLSRTSTGLEPASDSGAQDVQQLAQLEVPWSLALAGVMVDAGVQLRRDQIRAERVPGGTRVLHSVEPFVQATWSAGPLQVTPGARVTASERWGTVVAPRIAALWRPVPVLGVRAAVGRGYRAPDFKELYLEFVNAAAGYAVRGNADLEPETASNVSASAEWLAGPAYARAGAFDNRYRDFIDTGAPDATGTFTYRNVARGSTRGVELEAGFTSSHWRLETGYAYLHARDDATGAPLLGRPAHSARLAASVTAGWLRLGSTLLYTGATPLQQDAFGAITGERAGFARLDLRAAARLPWTLELSAGVDNVFDRTLGAEWPGFTGRQAFVGLRWVREAGSAAVVRR